MHKIHRLHIFIISLILVGCSHHHGNNHDNHRFDNAKKWQKAFENKKRDTWQKPMQVIKAVGVTKKSHIADIGSATGFFPVRLARVATEGRVWGIDLSPSMVRYLNKRASKEQLENLFSILASPDDPLIPRPVDFIFMVNTYHHINDRIDYFNRLRSKLRKNGKLVIIDFKKKRLPLGPKLEMKIAAKDIISELSASGYKLVKDHRFLEYQNLLEFEPR